MSDNHRGLPHDLPEYVPNWPVPVKVKAKVYQLPNSGRWSWSHACPKRNGWAMVGHPERTQAAAFEAALKHARGCW